MVTVHEVLLHKARGGVHEYVHGRKENKQTTLTQNFLDRYWSSLPEEEQLWKRK